MNNFFLFSSTFNSILGLSDNIGCWLYYKGREQWVSTPTSHCELKVNWEPSMGRWVSSEVWLWLFMTLHVGGVEGRWWGAAVNQPREWVQVTEGGGRGRSHTDEAANLSEWRQTSALSWREPGFLFERKRGSRVTKWSVLGPQPRGWWIQTTLK